MASTLNKIKDQQETAFVSGFNIGGASVEPVHNRKIVCRDFNVVGVQQLYIADEDFAIDTIFVSIGLLNNTSSTSTLEIGLNGNTIIKCVEYMRLGTAYRMFVAIPFNSIRIKKGEIISYYLAPDLGALLGGATFSLIGHII